MSTTKTILVAPLNWGLGHATRSIPIINELLKHQFKVLLGGDGASLELLRKEFPDLPYIALPSYNISYPKYPSLFAFRMLLKLPHFRKVMHSEEKIVAQLVRDKKIDGIISDNRLGVCSDRIPSVYITHQLQVFSGSTTPWSTHLHQKIIKKFTQCWVPDVAGTPNLSGALGHTHGIDIPVIYIGPLTRMAAEERHQKYDVLILLSGPEPQRTLLEKKLMEAFATTSLNILLVQGVVEEVSTAIRHQAVTVINYLQTEALEKVINESKFVIARSGYSTIMDLSVMGKKLFCIPTPGQYEQEYLAKHLEDNDWAPYCSQKEFHVSQLERLKDYSGLLSTHFEADYASLFSLFQGE